MSPYKAAWMAGNIHGQGRISKKKKGKEKKKANNNTTLLGYDNNTDKAITQSHHTIPYHTIKHE
jgi:hypothetical protein